MIVIDLLEGLRNDPSLPVIDMIVWPIPGPSVPIYTDM